MGRRIGEIDQDVIMTGGLVVGGFFIIRYLFKSLGIGTDPADLQTIQDQQTSTPGDNPFSPQYQPAVDLFNANPSQNSDGSTMSMSQYYQAIKQLNDNNDPSLTGLPKQAAVWAEALNSLLTGFHLTGTDQNAVMAIFSQLQDAQQVADISAYLLYNYNEDLLTMLHGSIFNYGLTPSNLAIVIKNINNLPS